NIKLCYINEVKECMQDLIISFKKEREWRARVDIIKSLIFLAERGEHIFNDSFKEIAYLLLEDEVYTVRKEAGFLFKKLIKLYGVDFYKDDDKKLLSLISHIKYQYRIAAISVVIEILNNTEDIRYLYLLDELSSDIVLGVRFALLHEIRESFINKKFKNEIINIIVAMSITSCDQL
ncbi:Phosphoprotein phosphatase, partial [Spraguea lophii 42_110]